ncbi:hypothetical protein LJ046_00680 [Lactobacillus delbrueckii subsp. jakobsenii ZN7a-9 = DSM 26046]|nr:hypothetical protein LJ046_00680 [Lactobacillus delbrueckii subsp. jakobsenii ZN7a-9 = DSM 26046]MCT3486718.1 hypothetical protein [Lactobacillus delbrueckii subsp. lactis]
MFCSYSRPHLVQYKINYSNGYTRLPIKIPETISNNASGHLFESDFRLCFKLFLDDPLVYNLTDQFLKVYQLVIIEPQAVAMLSISPSQSLTVSC